ncbi:MAG: hypothetical protein UT54_C0044G0009 [Candidatus Daviesbacteria bacterium GW2011_GWB1_39_5]|nr:MAG: hypothetical protein UT54_C0044G0009 [Candidatus Daviesbacteria bacterium GW2011_GWB1_39_5]
MHDSLKKSKKDYLDIEPQTLLESGWRGLEQRIDRQRYSRRLFAFSVIFSVILLVATGTFSVQMTQAALPGEVLYPLKRTSENVVTLLSNDKNMPVENRVKEIMGLVEKEEKLEREKSLRQQEVHVKILETVGEYSKNVSEVRGDLEKSGSKDENFQKRLDDHRGKFESLIQKHPSCAKELQGAIEITKSGKSEDGNKDENGNSGGSGSSGKGS